MIRIVVADDEHLIRAGLRAILSAEPDLLVVGEAADGAEAAALAREQRADVVLMDVHMPGVCGVEGIELTRQANPLSKVLMLTVFDVDAQVRAALEAGACGYLLKTSPAADLVTGVRDAHLGRRPFHPQVTSRLIAAFVREPVPRADVPRALRGLSPRELEVFRGLAAGSTNAEIAAELFLGEATVKTHVASILGKLGLRDRIQAVVLAYECGLVRGG